MNFWRFDTTNPTLGPVMEGHNDPLLVSLSIVIACFAGVTVLALADRITAAREVATRAWWITGGAVAMACGMWSMHFTGMLAFELPGHNHGGYDAGLTLLSLFPAVIGSMVALHFIADASVRGWRLQLGSLLLASGIGAMHYTGMEAMRMPGLRYDFGLFVLSIVIAHVLAIAALSIRARLRAMRIMPENAVSYFAGPVVGLSIAGMHYTAMAAARFHHVGDGTSHGTFLSDGSMAASIGMFAGVILVLSLLATWIDRQVGFQRLLQLERMAHTDALTGLPNRVMLDSQLETALNQNRCNDHGFALFNFDLNKFKPINDTYGHAAGDLILREFATRLQNCLRQNDLAARVGGDEFVALCRDMRDPESAARMAERILKALEKPVKLNRIELPLSVSIGISLYPADGDSAKGLKDKADDAMYRAKTGGLGYCFAGNHLNRSLEDYQRTSKAIMEAMEASDIQVLYQPEVDLATGNIRSLEALVRCPSNNSVTASEFISLTDSNGLSTQLSSLVLQAVCRQARAWLDDNIDFGKVAVNVSPAQFSHPEFARQAKSILQQFSLPAERLELEVSHQDLQNNKADQLLQLVQLRDLGVSLTLDRVEDLSLERISELPFQRLKIGRELIGQSATALNAVAKIRAIAALANALNLDLSCSGIETEAQKELLMDAGCHSAQGYYFYIPTSADIIASLINSDQSTEADWKAS